jgi:hypothetical protein
VRKGFGFVELANRHEGAQLSRQNVHFRRSRGLGRVAAVAIALG